MVQEDQKDDRNPTNGTGGPLGFHLPAAGVTEQVGHARPGALTISGCRDRERNFHAYLADGERVARLKVSLHVAVNGPLIVEDDWVRLAMIGQMKAITAEAYGRMAA